MQVTINLDKELVELMDEVAERLHISRSAYISITMSRAVNAEKANEQLPLMAANFNTFFQNFLNMSEEEQQKALKADFEDTKTE